LVIRHLKAILIQIIQTTYIYKNQFYTNVSKHKSILSNSILTKINSLKINSIKLNSLHRQTKHTQTHSESLCVNWFTSSSLFSYLYIYNLHINKINYINHLLRKNIICNEIIDRERKKKIHHMKWSIYRIMSLLFMYFIFFTKHFIFFLIFKFFCKIQ
jgi:hypothetical protein